ncbi:hypothetical protein BC829DRAFT_435526 [Chytridium lagenaria]|nr:hypothetical protein BC829DRAFT_435526 [Chytridium lagenaria]
MTSTMRDDMIPFTKRFRSMSTPQPPTIQIRWSTSSDDFATHMSTAERRTALQMLTLAPALTSAREGVGPGGAGWRTQAQRWMMGGCGGTGGGKDGEDWEEGWGMSERKEGREKEDVVGASLAKGSMMDGEGGGKIAMVDADYDMEDDTAVADVGKGTTTLLLTACEDDCLEVL